jgi:hypothetical protein
VHPTVRRVLICGLSIAATGCTWAKNAAHAVTPRADPPENVRWNGVLYTAADTMGDTASMAYGTAWLAPAPGNLILTRVMVVRARPGARYQWQVHLGNCWRDRGEFGAGNSYPTIAADSTGTATGEARLPLGFPNSGAYFVRVYAIDSGPPDRLCGSLIKPF